MDRATFQRRLPDRPLAPKSELRAPAKLSEARRHIVLRCAHKRLTVVLPQGRKIAFAQLRCVGEDDSEYGLELVRRARDDAEHLGRCRLLLQRCGQLAREQSDILLFGTVTARPVRGAAPRPRPSCRRSPSAVFGHARATRWSP